MDYKWHEYFIKLADVIAEKSKDQSTKVGAVIVGPDHEIRSTGYNGFPRGVRESGGSYGKRWERPEKYLWVVHAELNAILNAARHGAAVKDCSLYLNWEPIPCNECCKAIANSGIKAVYGPNRPFIRPNQEKDRKNWHESLEISKLIMKETGIKSVTVSKY